MKEENLVYDTSDEDADVFQKAEDHDDEIDSYVSVVSKAINSGKSKDHFRTVLISHPPFIVS